MEKKDIETLPVEPHMPQKVKELRKKAPEYIRSIVEDSYAIKEISSLSDLDEEDIEVLGGGMLSANYLLKTSKQSLVIKFRMGGIEAEAEALAAWRKTGANVVDVISFGIVPATRGGKKELKYLVLQAVTNKQGRLAKTCQEYVEEYPDKAFTIGRALGEQLALIHKATSKRTFGEFSDMWGKNNAPIKTWAGYLNGYIDQHYQFLRKLGFTKLQIETIRESFYALDFPKRGIYTHGDFSMRNAMLMSVKPLVVVVFDPNPVIGDPSWDLTTLYNNRDYATERAKLKPRSKFARKEEYMHTKLLDGLILEYEKRQGKINELFVAASQFVQTTFLCKIEMNKALSHKVDPEKEVEVVLRRNVLFRLGEKLLEYGVKAPFQHA